MSEKTFLAGRVFRERRAAKPVGIAAVLTLSLALAACSTDLTWTEFEAESGRFSVEMPGTPELEVISAPTAAGDVDVSIATVEVDDSGFLASETVFPPGTPISLTGAADGAVSNSMTGSITSSTEVDLDGVPCLRFSAAGEASGQDVETESIVCHADDRLFQLTVVNGGDNPERTDRFMDSLNFMS